MNLYDFDNTIYKGDSGVDLILYSLAKYPFKVSFSIIKTIPLMVLFMMKRRNIKDIKNSIFSYLNNIKELDEFIEKFIDKKMVNIKKWYLDTQKENDIIISASLETWIIPFCKRLNIKTAMGTKMKDGKIFGNNCSGKEKIVRLKEKFPNASIEKSYSDSKKDIPILEIAHEAFVVKGDKLIKYETGYFDKKH